MVIVIVVFIIVVYLVIVVHRRRINIYHNARLISDRVPQRALAVTLGTIVGGHDGAMLCHPGGSRRYHTIFAPHLVDYCIVVVNFVVSIILCHCHATTNRLPIQFCCIQPLVLPYRNYCNHVPSLLIQEQVLYNTPSSRSIVR